MVSQHKPVVSGEAPMVLDESTEILALTLAMTVRNAMEDFHVEHLTDGQMAELNPIIRNAIATGLHAFLHQEDPRCLFFVQFQQMLIPDYWEPPRLTEDLTESSGEYADRVRLVPNEDGPGPRLTLELELPDE